MNAHVAASIPAARHLAVSAALLVALAPLACGDDAGSTSAGTGGAGSTTSSTGGATVTANTVTIATSATVTAAATTTTGTGGMGGGGPSGWAGPVPSLQNDPDCSTWMVVAPAAGEAGHLYAVRLTPGSYPFTVDEIVYELGDDGDTCDATPAHRVEVFVDTASAPAGTPAGTVVLDIPAAGSNAGVRVVSAPLPAPITLSAGEHLFVAVELPAVGSSCVMACGGAAVTDRDYWSNATIAPYPWATLDSFGIDAHARVGANGM